MSRRHLFPRPAWLLGMMLFCMPLLAADESPADSPTGQIFRWLNFALVFGAFAYVIPKYLAPVFRSHAKSISGSIQSAAADRAQAERELKEATQQLAGLDLESQDLRRAAAKESTAEAERIRELARTESEKIEQAARAEIAAAEQAARQELRATAARLATENAAAMLRARMTGATEASMFQKFVGELTGSAS